MENHWHIEELNIENWNGGLAQLARAPALQAGGHRFESDILHFILRSFSEGGLSTEASAKVARLKIARLK